MRYIDADKLMEVLNGFTKFHHIEQLSVGTFIDMIVDMTDADVREVVRCKECKHARFHDYAPAECPYYCTLAVNYHSQNFYCALGERGDE